MKMVVAVLKQEVEAYLDAGFNDHLAKPLDREELRDKLNKYCQKIIGDEPESKLSEQVFQDLRDKFKLSFSDYKEQLQDALKTSDQLSLAQIAHKFQGAARSFHFDKEGTVAETLEQQIYQSKKAIDKTALQLISLINEHINKSS